MHATRNKQSNGDVTIWLRTSRINTVYIEQVSAVCHACITQHCDLPDRDATRDESEATFSSASCIVLVVLNITTPPNAGNQFFYELMHQQHISSKPAGLPQFYYYTSALEASGSENPKLAQAFARSSTGPLQRASISTLYRPPSLRFC